LGAVAGLKTERDVYKYTRRSPAEIGMSKIESDAPGGAAGRTPICSLAQLAWAKCGVDHVERAVSSFMEHRSELERVRKVTDSHYGRYGNAPYYFFYDYAFAAEAMTRLPDPKRRELLTTVRDDLLKIQESDGSWLDCHPIGKNAGTAQALVALRHCAGEVQEHR